MLPTRKDEERVNLSSPPTTLWPASTRLMHQGLEADEDALSQEVCSNPWTKVWIKAWSSA